MRVPRIYRRAEELDNNPTIETIEIQEGIFDEPLQYSPDVDFDDKKSIESYIKSVKYLIRQSDKYTSLMTFLKTKRDMSSCFFFPKIKKHRGSKIKIEIHHTGFVMEDIIRAVLMKRYKNNEDFGYQAIAKEVMLCHYNGWISLTALSKTAHKLIHSENSTLFIPLQMADIGDCKIFYEEYKDYMDKDLINKFEQYKLLSDAVDNIEDIIPDYLDRKYIYYERKGIELPDMEKILEILELEQ